MVAKSEPMVAKADGRRSSSDGRESLPDGRKVELMVGSIFRPSAQLSDHCQKMLTIPSADLVVRSNQESRLRPKDNLQNNHRVNYDRYDTLKHFSAT